MLDTGEGNSIIDSETGWYIEDLSGWLVDKTEKSRIIQSKENGTAYEDFSEAYVFAKWSKQENGKLEISFIKY